MNRRSGSGSGGLGGVGAGRSRWGRVEALDDIPRLLVTPLVELVVNEDIVSCNLINRPLQLFKIGMDGGLALV